MHNPLTLFEEYIDRAGIIKILSSLRARGDYGRYDLLSSLFRILLLVNLMGLFGNMNIRVLLSTEREVKKLILDRPYDYSSINYLSKLLVQPVNCCPA